MKSEDIQMVCISLDRRPDRWSKFKQYTDIAGIQVMHLPAVDAKEFDAVTHPSVSLLTAHNIKYKVRRAHYEIDTGGAVGASLSHFKAWNYLVSSNAPALIVFEDDAIIPADFSRRLSQVVAELPAEWDLITFYNTEYLTSRGCSPDPKTAPLQNCIGLMGAHAYMISRRGAQRLLARAYPVELHVDAYIAFMARLGHISMLWNPCMQVMQPFDDSDIAHGNTRILGVPTDMDKSWITALDAPSVIGLVIMAAVAGGIIARTLKPF
jgi:GR25 family glycosyltransferase involved in LPS biosynthesis